MKKKLFSFIMALCFILPCAFCLMGCDLLPGGDEVDITLHHLTLTTNIPQLVSPSDLNATFAFGERHDISSRPQDDVDSLLADGATQEDIDKAGVKQTADNSYWFFSQDPIIISAPEGEDVTGYMFLGFYEQGKNTCLYKPELTQCQLDNGSTEMLMKRWNMLSRDIVLEARYAPLTYSITYCYGITSGPDRTHTGIMPEGTHSNPLSYNYEENPNVTLLAPTEEIAGYEFKHWYYVKLGAVEPTICTSLPKVFDEDAIHVIDYDSNNNPQYGITLFAVYEEKFYTFSFEHNPIISSGTIAVTRNGGSVTSVEIPKNSDATISIDNCKAGDKVTVSLMFTNDWTADDVHQYCNFEGVANEDGDIVYDGSLIVNGHSYFEIIMGEDDITLHLDCSPKP